MHNVTNGAQLSLVNIMFNVKNKPILQEVSLRLPATGVSAILGFNGAGKSVLLKIMHGIIAPSNGEVLWNDQPIDSNARTQQAMVFQKPVLLRRSVKANIDFALKQRGAHSTTQREDLLKQVSLEHKASQAARLLSGGEQQRLALARALAYKPKVLFLDEATASLDSASTAIIETIVRDQSNAGTKIIMVTHDAAQAARLASDIVFIHDGKVAEHTSSSSFFSHPHSAPAQAYLDGRLYTDSENNTQ